MRAIDEDYVTVAEAATLLRVNPSTIRRWIRQGDIPAYRVGHRRVALKRADLANVIGPARTNAENGSNAGIAAQPEIRRLTPEEQRRGLQALERLERLQQELLARRGGQPFSPSWTLINEMRDERSRQLG